MVYFSQYFFSDRKKTNLDYSGTPLIRTPMGPIAIVLISGVSAFQGVKIYSSNGDTFRSFRAKCPLNRGVRISEVRISGSHCIAFGFSQI